MISAFGVDHGGISKADDKYGKHGAPSAGRRATAHFFPGWHGAIAGKKGKKLRSGASQVGAGIGGSVAGQLAGGALGAAATRGRSVGAVHGAATVGGLGGAVTGSQLNLNRLQRKGYLKKES
jgi:hypothetical protein